VSKIGVLVQCHLGVERVHGALGGEDEGVDLGEVAVARGVAVVELDQEFCGLLSRDFVELGFVDPAPRGRQIEPTHGIDREKGNGGGILLGLYFDPHATLSAHHPQMSLVRPVQGEGGVVLLGDIARALDPQATDHVALNVQTENIARVQSHLVHVVGQLHPASLAATADLDLGLDDHRKANSLGHRDGFVNRVSDVARRDGDAEAREVLLALILKEIHPLQLSFDERSMYKLLRYNACSRESRADSNHEPISASEAPGVKMRATPAASSGPKSSSGMIPPTTSNTSSRPISLSNATIRGTNTR